MKNRKVCRACAAAGLVLCAHLGLAPVFESGDHAPHHGGASFVMALMPPEPPHTHNEIEGSARIVSAIGANVSSGSVVLTPHTGDLQFGR